MGGGNQRCRGGGRNYWYIEKKGKGERAIAKKTSKKTNPPQKKPQHNTESKDWLGGKMFKGGGQTKSGDPVSCAKKKSRAKKPRGVGRKKGGRTTGSGNQEQYLQNR